jgi:ATP-dependent exoDNAse (exonuclease V) beta subunit
MKPQQDSFDLEALKLDDFQKKAAYTEDTAIVTAGAGAGKTRALVGRFLYLVLQKNVDPERILALTFTRKAAAEMFQRVQLTLSPFANDSPALAKSLVQAHIQTLDSFCREIVAQTATLYGYTPDFKIDESKCARIAEKTAYRYVLDNQKENGLESLVATFGFEAVVQDLFASFGRANVEPNWQGKQICRSSAQIGEQEFRKIAAEISNKIHDIALNILEIAHREPNHDFKEGTNQAIRMAKAVSSFSCDLTGLRDFLDYMEKPENALNMRSIGRNETESAIKELAKELKDKSFQDKISQVLDFEEFLPTYYAIMNRLDEYADMLCEEKCIANIMNYKDLGALAVDILSKHEDRRIFWASRFQYILIDEFQDNNELQKQLLFLLSKEGDEIRRGKLFFVGDEKQSIYLFRGANVSVFKGLADELMAVPLSLTRNYRSTSQLIEFFNELFRIVMQPANPENPQPFEARYEDMETRSIADSNKEEPQGFSSRIEYHCITSKTPLEEAGSLYSVRESMAFRLALWIRNAVESSNPLFIRNEKQMQDPAAREANHSETSLRKAEYSDIAVLMRTTSRQYEIEKYLRMLAIPFVSDTAASLFSEEPINDLYYLLRLLVDADDLFATAAVLRSPLCRISNDGFVSILTEKKSLADLEAGIPKELNPNDKNSVERMISFYRELRPMSDHMPLMELIAYLWKNAQLEASILCDEQRLPYLEHWNAIRTIAASIEAEGGHIAAFLISIRDYMQNMHMFDTSSVPKTEAHGVHLLTIHKSKGLEFPIVIIPWTEASTNRNSGKELWGILESDQEQRKTQFYTVDIGFHDRIKSASNILQTQAKALRTEKEQAETKRLLYVACTRAIDHLAFFCAAPEKRSYDKDSFHALLFKDKSHLLQQDSDDKTQLPSHLSDLRLFFEPLVSDKEIQRARSQGLIERKLSQKELLSQEEAQKLAPTSKETSCKIASKKEEVLAEHAIMTNLTSNSVANHHSRHITISSINAIISKETLAADYARELSKHFVREHIFIPLEHQALSETKAPDKVLLEVKNSWESLNSSAYGSLVHELFAHLLAGKSIESYRPSVSISRQLLGNTSATDIDVSNTNKATHRHMRFLIENAARELAPFFEAPRFSTLILEKKYSCEFPFLLGLGRWIIEGRMDFITQRDEEVIILDLKSDQRFSPYEYSLQLALYIMAARQLFQKKKVRAGLMYLHFGEIAWLETEPEEKTILRICDSISFDKHNN